MVITLNMQLRRHISSSKVSLVPRPIPSFSMLRAKKRGEKHATWEWAWGQRLLESSYILLMIQSILGVIIYYYIHKLRDYVVAVMFSLIIQHSELG